MASSLPPALGLDFTVVRESLRAGKATPAWLARWLPAAYEAPESFRAALYAYAASRREDAIKSRPQVGFDFYHDCVLAHVGQRRRALALREGREQVALTFESLHVRCSALAAAWAREGVVPGTKVCVLLPSSSVTFAVAVLAALRLGAVLSVVSPRGKRYVETRLAALAPARLATDGAGARLAAKALPAEALLPLAASAGDVATGMSHTYVPGEIAAELLSPLVGGGSTPFALTADVLHLGLLRDALLVHALDGRDALAAPGFPDAQHQPTLLLATLMGGAAYVDLDPKELALDPKLTNRMGITVLGVTVKERDRLLGLHAAGRLGKPAERAWFRSLSEPLDFAKWEDFARAMGKESVLGYGVHASAATAGTQVFATPKPPPLGLGVIPAPGAAWQLSEIAGDTVPALGTSGVFTVFHEEEVFASVQQVVLGKSGDEWLFVGPLEQGPNGCSYPVEEVALVAETHPLVRSAAVVIVPGRWINDARVVVLAFTDELDPSARAEIPDELRVLVAAEMGDDALPLDRVEVFPLRPRYLEDGRVDRAWCRSEYLGGGLGRKADSELHLALARLGWIFAEPREGP